jgi:hypothetical protein
MYLLKTKFRTFVGAMPFLGRTRESEGSRDVDFENKNEALCFRAPSDSRHRCA